MTISGGNNSSNPKRPKLYVGYYPVPPNQHYQSLLPKDENVILSLKSGTNKENEIGRKSSTNLKYSNIRKCDVKVTNVMQEKRDSLSPRQMKQE